LLRYFHREAVAVAAAVVEAVVMVEAVDSVLVV
jgi:hypothetical protein